jgi:hypothetical protein
MSFMTEDEARQKKCPYVAEYDKCIGSECMAWEARTHTRHGGKEKCFICDGTGSREIRSPIFGSRQKIDCWLCLGEGTLTRTRGGICTYKGE